LNKIEPHSYLAGVITAIVKDHKQKHIDQLLPWNFRAWSNAYSSSKELRLRKRPTRATRGYPRVTMHLVEAQKEALVEGSDNLKRMFGRCLEILETKAYRYEREFPRL
jgi:hypothetical protein